MKSKEVIKEMGTGCFNLVGMAAVFFLAPHSVVIPNHFDQMMREGKNRSYAEGTLTAYLLINYYSRFLGMAFAAIGIDQTWGENASMLAVGAYGLYNGVDFVLMLARFAGRSNTGNIN